MKFGAWTPRQYTTYQMWVEYCYWRTQVGSGNPPTAEGFVWFAKVVHGRDVR